MARVPRGDGLNISTPDNPRGRMSRQHGRRPSSRWLYVYNSSCSAMLAEHSRTSEDCNIPLLNVYKLSNCKYNSTNMLLRCCISCVYFFFLFFFYHKLERAFIFDRWRAFYSRAVLNAFSFLPAAPRDYVLESRMKCNREAEPVKKPRRQNLHYCPRDHLGNLGIHRSQSDFKIKRGRSEREQGRGENSRRQSYVSPFRERTCCSIARRRRCRTAHIVYHRCSSSSRERTAGAGPGEDREI